MQAPQAALGLATAISGLVAFAVVSASNLHAQTAASNELTASLEQLRTRHQVPALAAAAWIDGRVVEVAATGVRKVGDSAKATAKDQWHIGSCTKAMTASLAAMLVEEGKLRWESTVGEILGDIRKQDPGWKSVTLEQLFQHRGGAPADPPAALWEAAWKASGSPTQQRRKFVEGLLASPPEARNSGGYTYSNQGYAIAGAMLEKVAGKSWEDLMRDRLFRPLGMTDAGFGAPGRPGRVDQPLGHQGKRPPLRPVEVGPQADNPVAIGPAGTVHCSISDFVTFGGWHAMAGRGEKPLLKPETFQRLHQVPAGSDYAMGWSTAERPWAGGKVLMHAGSNTMWFAVIWIAPGKRAAFAAITNTASENATKVCDEAVSLLVQRRLPK